MCVRRCNVQMKRLLSPPILIAGHEVGPFPPGEIIGRREREKKGRKGTGQERWSARDVERETEREKVRKREREKREKARHGKREREKERKRESEREERYGKRQGEREERKKGHWPRKIER